MTTLAKAALSIQKSCCRPMHRPRSLTGNAKLAGFSLTVTAIISLVVMTALHALLPGA